jgi:hypothetical protein
MGADLQNKAGSRIQQPTPADEFVA